MVWTNLFVRAMAEKQLYRISNNSHKRREAGGFLNELCFDLNNNVCFLDTPVR